jgi:hypothetical protein
MSIPYVLCILYILGMNSMCYVCSWLCEKTLDQLFIHLDDPDPTVQSAVFRVIIRAADIDKELVLRKAEANQFSHRSTDMCRRVMLEVRGYEVLS